MNATIIARGHENGDARLSVEDFRFVYDAFGSTVDARAIVAAPEYGAGRVIISGWKVKKNGTVGNQIVKPVANITALPQEMREALAALGYSK